jgi:hypothetical protein
LSGHAPKLHLKLETGWYM